MSEQKIAILDFYKGTENDEVGQLLDLAKETLPGTQFDVFDVRSSMEFPDLSYAALHLRFTPLLPCAVCATLSPSRPGCAGCLGTCVYALPSAFARKVHVQ